ncbi:hypothetical protein ThvES_00004290 [Thiovulum sp. ES]|nr:hypothetical protein ThvES_00004290 [Thiovulum sp. ES]
MILKKDNLFSYFILTISLAWLMIDTLNGIIGYFKDLYIFSSFFRAIVFFVMYIYIYKYFYKNLFFNLTSALLFLLTIIHVILFANVESVKMVIKVLMPLLMYFTFNIMLKKQHISFKNIKFIIIINTSVILLNLYLYYFGIGFDNYGIDDTTKLLKGGTGFFYAGNEVGATLIALLILNIFIFYKKNIIFISIVVMFFLIASLALMSKTAIFGVLLIYFLYLFSRYAVTTILSYLFVTITSTILYVYNIFIEQINLTIERWSYFYNEYGVVYLFGGIKRWTHVHQWILDISANPFSLFYGTGWSGECENNFFDLLQAFGIAGFIIFIFWVGIFFKLFKTKKYNPKMYFVSLSYGILIGISFFAGHVMQSAMLSLFLVLVSHSNKIYALSNKL